jgi:uncharacterized protein with PhoU and TrkA domain
MKYEEIKKLPVKKVTWLDATDKTLNIKELENKTDINLLTERTTIGWLYKTDKDKIILIRDVTEDGDIEISTIPKKWIIN